MAGFYCLKCQVGGVLVTDDGYHFGCSGRVIPQATICNPPEPTVIEASDLAPGMVVVAVDDERSPMAFICSPDAALSHGFQHQFVSAWRMRLSVVDADADDVRRIAGRGRPC